MLTNIMPQNGIGYFFWYKGKHIWLNLDTQEENKVEEVPKIS